MKDLTVSKGYVVTIEDGSVHVFTSRPKAMEFIDLYISSEEGTLPAADHIIRYDCHCKGKMGRLAFHQKDMCIDGDFRTSSKDDHTFSDGISKCCGAEVSIETEEGLDGQVIPHHRCTKCKNELFPPSK
jgi:hypothetical protein